MSERLQKFLARAGVASRRSAEELITNGRVKVNNATVTALGTKVDPATDLVTVDGRAIHAREEERYYLLYKPAGCVTTMRDPEGRPTAADYLAGVKDRVFPVGRLDYDAEGAVLFTTDGALANRLAHPRYGHRRTYLVKVKPPGGPDADVTTLHAALARMVQGLRLEDGPAKALEAVVHEEAEKNVWIRIVLGEGRHHLVKRLCEAVGLPVLRLFRPEFGGVSVQGLRPGSWRPLSPDEVRTMERAGGIGGDAGEAPPAPRIALPKAARRHGHGPPAPPSRGEATPGAKPSRADAAKAAASRGAGGWRPPARAVVSGSGERDARRDEPARRFEIPADGGAGESASPSGRPARRDARKPASPFRSRGSEKPSRPWGKPARDAGKPPSPSGRAEGHGAGKPTSPFGKPAGRGAGKPEGRFGKPAGRGAGKPEGRFGKPAGRGAGRPEGRFGETAGKPASRPGRPPPRGGKPGGRPTPRVGGGGRDTPRRPTGGPRRGGSHR
jgi:23S rRNA pseudouridine2605 synthase